MAKKQIPNIDAGDLIAKRETRKAATLVRTLVGGEGQPAQEAAPARGKAPKAEASTGKEDGAKRGVGRPKTTQRKRTTFFIDEALLEAIRREKYETRKDATQIVNEALYRYFGM